MKFRAKWAALLAAIILPALPLGADPQPGYTGGSGNNYGQASYVPFAGQAPSNTAAPTISGNNWEGQTLTATTGTWDGTPTSYTYQWTADGSNIGGATSSTYVLATGQAEKVVRVIVTAHNATGTGTATSAATATVMGNPVTIFGSDLAAWYDPSDSSSLTQSGGLVSQMNDKSGNGYHLTATGTARPTYSATGIMSNSPGLYFNGSSNIMAKTSMNIGASAFSVFTLSSLDEAGGAGTQVEMFSYKADGDAGSYSTHSSKIWWLQTGFWQQTVKNADGGKTNTIPIVGAIQPIYCGIQVRYGAACNGTTSQVFVDNQGSTAVSYTAPINTPGTFAAGARVDGSNWCKGYLGETVVLRRAPTSAERLQLNSWMIRSWSRVLIAEGDSVVHEGPVFGTPEGSVPGRGGFAYISVPNISPKAFLDDIAIGGSDMQSASNSGLIFRRSAYLDNRIPANKYGKKYIVFFYVCNNIGTSSPLANQAAAIAAYAASLKAAGADKVVTATILPRNDAGANEPARLAANTTLHDPTWSGLTANGGNVDAIVDWAADPIMGDATSQTDHPTYWADGVHPSTLGHTVLEPYFTATMNSLP